MDTQRATAAFCEDGKVAAGLGRLDHAKGVLLPGNRQGLADSRAEVHLWRGQGGPGLRRLCRPRRTRPSRVACPSQEKFEVGAWHAIQSRAKSGCLTHWTNFLRRLARSTTMQLGMIGLGRMGANMVRRLEKAGHKCVVYDRSADSVKQLSAEGATGANSVDDFVSKLQKPRAVWLMVPA